MAKLDKEMKTNDYRNVNPAPGAANDPAAIKRMNLRDDRVSVVHSGETDTMPNRDAQEAYADEDDATLESSGPILSDEKDQDDFEYQQGMAEGTKVDEDEEELSPAELKRQAS